MMRIWLVLTYTLWTVVLTPVSAQPVLGVAGQVDFPLMFNANVGSYNHALGAFGPRLSFGYFPQNTTFYPSISVNTAAIELPLAKLNNGIVVNIRFFQASASVWANSRKSLNKSELHYGLGIGATYLSSRDVVLSGPAENVTFTTLNSSEKATVTPNVNLMMEYCFPISKEKPLWLGLAGKLQYMYFFDNTVQYSVTIGDNYQGNIPVSAPLQGHLLNPGALLSLYYRFGQRQKY
jgi:hypothetical protein